LINLKNLEAGEENSPAFFLLTDTLFYIFLLGYRKQEQFPTEKRGARFPRAQSLRFNRCVQHLTKAAYSGISLLLWPCIARAKPGNTQ
jgi:hypothetical protein